MQELCALHCEREPGAPKHWAVRAYLARECGAPAEVRAALPGQLGPCLLSYPNPNQVLA